MINDIFKSFFRTIGRIMAYLLVGIFIGLFVVKCEVNAASIIPKTIYFDGSNHNFSTGKFEPNVDNSFINLNYESGLNGSFNTRVVINYYLANLPANPWKTSDFHAYAYLGDKKVEMTKSCNNEPLGSTDDIVHIVCQYDNVSTSTSPINYYVQLTHPKTAFNIADTYFTLSARTFYVIDSGGSSGGDTGGDSSNPGSSDTDSIINNNNQNKDDIINNQDKNTDEVLNNQNQNKQEIIDNQNKNNEELKDSINDNFNNCRDSKNLFNYNYGSKNISGLSITYDEKLFDLIINGTPQTDYIVYFRLNNDSIKSFLLNNKTYTFSQSIKGFRFILQLEVTDLQTGKVSYFNTKDGSLTHTMDYDKYSYRISLQSTSLSYAGTFNNYRIKFQIEEGSTSSKIEPFGKICTNRIDDTNKKLDEAEETRKGILETIKGIFSAIAELPKKLVELLIEGLKSLFIPSDDFFSNKFDELTQNVEKKMGVLAYPLTITIETFQFLLTVEDTGSYIITWPDVVVPNFDFVIIPSGSFDLSIILENGWINMAHNLYMIFVSTYLLLSFFKFCNNKYSDMFGGDYDNTDYVIVEDSIVDVHDNEDGSKRYVNHKERRYKVGDE